MSKYLLLVIGLILLGLSHIFTFHTIVLSLINLLIIIEFSRMIYEFILGSDNRMKLRYAHDASIIVLFRELYLTAVNLHTDFEHSALIFAVLVPSICILIIARIVLVRYSPDLFKP